MTAATRSNVLAARRRLEQVEKGASLLRHQRKSLAVELFSRATPAVEARRKVDQEARSAYRALIAALAELGSFDVERMGWPAKELRLELEPREVAGVHGVDLVTRPVILRSVAARGVAIGPGDAAAVAAAERFEHLLERLIALVPDEALLRRLARALRQTTRRVNTLEQRVGPALARELSAIRRTLDEREREEHARLKRIARLRRPVRPTSLD